MVSAPPTPHAPPADLSILESLESLVDIHPSTQSLPTYSGGVPALGIIITSFSKIGTPINLDTEAGSQPILVGKLRALSKLEAQIYRERGTNGHIPYFAGIVIPRQRILSPQRAPKTPGI